MKAPLFTLRQLQYLLAVSETLHFRRAAERCQVSQPSLSAQIAELENALGVALFERNQRRVLLTEAGAALVERARRVLLEAADLSETAWRFTDPFTGTLRVGVIPTLAPYLLPRLAPALREAYPKLSLYWVEDKTAALVAAITRGELDAALVAREADLGDLVQVTLGKDPFWVALSPGHKLARQQGPLSLQDVQGEPLLLLGEEHCLRSQVLSFCSRSEPGASEFRATSVATLVQMVAGGLGVTLLPRLAAEVEGARGGVVLRPFLPPEPGRTLSLAWRRRSATAPALRALAATMQETLRGSSPPEKTSPAPRKRKP
jgi:LysR family hydrogen peroxide-inducible transcriptional activator